MKFLVFFMHFFIQETAKCYRIHYSGAEIIGLLQITASDIVRMDACCTLMYGNILIFW